MKKSGITSLCLVLFCGFIIPMAACVNGQSSEGENGGDHSGSVIPADPVNVEHSQSRILEGTVWETAVHRYVTDKQGPKIAIVGGIHGDERAGWTAGLQLVDKFTPELSGICGEILLIPQANVQADTLNERYQGSKSAKNGIGTVGGLSYSDLNRSFPQGRASNAQQTTITISDGVRAAVEEFAPDVVIDLHESLHSWTQQNVTSTSLGDTLIYKNQGVFMDDLLYLYNQKYKQAGEPDFVSNPASVAGSFNYYFSALYPNSVVFTIETNRGRNSSGLDTIALDSRVRQQLNVLEALFDLVWERVDISKI